MWPRHSSKTTAGWSRRTRFSLRGRSESRCLDLPSDLEQFDRSMRAGVASPNGFQTVPDQTGAQLRLRLQRQEMARHLGFIVSHQVIGAFTKQTFGIVPGRADEWNAAGQR